MFKPVYIQVIQAFNTGYCQPPPTGCPREVYAIMVKSWWVSLCTVCIIIVEFNCYAHSVVRIYTMSGHDGRSSNIGSSVSYLMCWVPGKCFYYSPLCDGGNQVYQDISTCSCQMALCIIYVYWEVLDDCCVQLLIIMDCERNHSMGESDGRNSPTVWRPIVSV